MARRNTANQEMIREFAELKKKGITDFICTTINDITGKHLKPVMKHTAQGVSSYANQMWSRYGDAVTVEVGYFDQEFNWKTYCTYHA